MKTSHAGSESETPPVALRRRAEVIAQGKAIRIPEDMESLSVEATWQMVHELQVHQIELEMQNEELRRAQKELNAAQARYFDLYDLAPVGYCTLSEQKLILEANLTVATLLGMARGTLVKQPITRFIFQQDQDLYYKHLKQLFESGEPQACELRMVKMDGAPVWVGLEATVAQDADGMHVCRVMLSDISKRKRAEEDLSLHVTRTQALLDLHLMATESQQAILDFVLEATQKACRSQFSFIGLMDETESFMTIHTWSKDTMAQCASVDKPIHFPISEAGVWGDCIRQRKPVTINDYEAPWPSKKGYPEGYVPIRRFLSVPIFDGNKIVAVAFVANKKEPYAEDDVNALISLVNKMWEILRRKWVEEELQRTLESLRKAVGVTIQVMASAVELRDPYTAGHQIRSADLARAIATEMGLPHEKIEGIRVAGSIHDIGKLSIPAEILSKPTKLSEIEFSLTKEHARSGFEMLKDVESPWPLAEMVYQHHERMDGSGYPRNLKGDDILIEARILAVSDVVESMASHRPYRAGLGIEAALEEIEKNRGTLYDEAVAYACLRLFREKGYCLVQA